jgi:CheY-like chemotaxis protein
MRVLIVEDHPDSAAMSAELLRLFGHRVEISPSAESALQQLRSFAAQLLLVDIALPGMSGLDLAREVRAMPGTRKICMWALTAHPSLADEAPAGAFDGVLMKPFDPNKLLSVLNSAPFRGS